MSLGTWTPENEAPDTVDPQWLRRCIQLVEQGHLQDLGAALDEAEQTRHAPLMRADEETWRPALETLDEAELLQLVKFFTVAEMQLPNWEAGERSPVIWINRLLRQRGSALPRELLQWIREHSDNRFIPYGAL
jgi:hypothetical protein